MNNKWKINNMPAGVPSKSLPDPNPDPSPAEISDVDAFLVTHPMKIKGSYEPNQLVKYSDFVIDTNIGFTSAIYNSAKLERSYDSNNGVGSPSYGSYSNISYNISAGTIVNQTNNTRYRYRVTPNMDVEFQSGDSIQIKTPQSTYWSDATANIVVTVNKEPDVNTSEGIRFYSLRDRKSVV